MATKKGAVDGFYYPGGKSRFGRPNADPVPATMSLEGNFVVLRSAVDGRLLGDAYRREADISLRVGDLSRQVALAGSWTFETADNNGIDRLLIAPIDRLAPWLARGLGRVLVFILGMILALFLGWRFGVPFATQIAVDRTPQSVEDSIANGVLNTWDYALFDPTEVPLARRARLEAEFQHLVDVYRQHPDARLDANFQLLFRDAPQMGPNALALPGGPIVFTDQLLDVLKDDDLIIAIAAHEIGHIHHRHSLYGLYRSAGVGSLIMFIGGDLTDLAEDAVIQAAALSNLSLSRAAEEEADLMGVELSLASGRDPLALVAALETLTQDCEDCGETSWFSTHPGLDDREAAIRAAIARAEASER